MTKSWFPGCFTLTYPSTPYLKVEGTWKPQTWFDAFCPHPSWRKPGRSQYVRFTEVELLLRHGEIPEVPEYPQNQAEEYEQRPRQNKKVPVRQWGKDPDEEQEEAHDVQKDGQADKEGGALALFHGWARWLGQVDVGRRCDKTESRSLEKSAFLVLRIIVIHWKHALHFSHSWRRSGRTGTTSWLKVRFHSFQTWLVICIC